VSQKAPNIFKENGLRLMLPYNLLDPEKQRPARILKSELTTSLGKRLTREAATQNVKVRNFFDGKLGDIAGKKLVVIREDRLILALIEVMPVSSTSGSVPLAGKDALSTLSIVKSYMESPDTRKEVDESVLILLGLSGHRLKKTT
jgi:hypothetical protein